MSDSQWTLADMSEEELHHIKGFIVSQCVFTIATCSSDGPWCAPCYYAFDANGMRLVFMSQPDTRHIREMLTHRAVAGSILPDRPTIGKIMGIQFTGMAIPCGPSADGHYLRDLYLKRFPFACTMKGDCFSVLLHTVKMTDNTLGFGSKLHWARTDYHHSPN